MVSGGGALRHSLLLRGVCLRTHAEHLASWVTLNGVAGLVLLSVPIRLFLVLVILRRRGVAHLLLWIRLLDHPVKDEIVLVPHAVEEVFKELPKVANIGLLVELKVSAVVEVDAKFVR